MKSLFFSNIRLKLLALIFAGALWFFVAGQSSTEVGFMVPLGFKNIPKDLVMASRPPDEVEVRVAGPKLFINNLSPTQITAELDLASAKEGFNTYRLTKNEIFTPMGVEVQKLRPVSVDIRMERLLTVNPKVRPRITGKPAQGYRISEISVSPAAVTASVTRRELQDLKEIYTKPVDVSGLSYSRSMLVPLDLGDYDIRSLSADKVELRITIKREK